MTIEEQIQYRKAIMDQAIKGRKITSEERRWMMTNPVYNRLLGFPYLNTDIIHLQSKMNYKMHIVLESKGYSGRILPSFMVPIGKGAIIYSGQLFNRDDREISQKSVKGLALFLDSQKISAEFLYWSEIGSMAVHFECEYFDEKQQLLTRKNSNTGDPDYAMKAEWLCDNKKRYWCKAPIENDFEGLVFTVEWERM